MTEKGVGGAGQVGLVRTNRCSIRTHRTREPHPRSLYTGDTQPHRRKLSESNVAGAVTRMHTLSRGMVQVSLLPSRPPRTRALVDEPIASRPGEPPRSSRRWSAGRDAFARRVDPHTRGRRHASPGIAEATSCSGCGRAPAIAAPVRDANAAWGPPRCMRMSATLACCEGPVMEVRARQSSAMALFSINTLSSSLRPHRTTARADSRRRAWVR